MSQQRIVELINLLIRNSISDAEFSELETELESNRGSRLLFIEHMNLHAELKRNYKQHEGEDEGDMEAISRQLDDLISGSKSDSSNESNKLFPPVGMPSQDFSNSNQRGILPTTAIGLWPVWFPAVCSIALLGVGIAYIALFDWQTEIESADRGPTEHAVFAGAEAEMVLAKTAVAVLTNDVNAVWNTDGVPLRLGQLISPGTIELTSGLAQIDFLCGATMILEGPARLEIENENSGFVHNGKLRVYVPERAIGFTLRSRQCEVIDLGTEFAMDVGVDANAEIHVLEGEVRVTDTANSGNEGKLLTSGNGVRFSGEAPAEDIESSKERFVGPAELTRLSKAAQMVGFDRWHAKSEQLKQDASLIAMYTFQETSDWDRLLINSNPNTVSGGDGAIVGCQWTKGRWDSKRALRFSSPSHRVRINVPGLHDAITLSSWVNIDSWDKDMALTHPDSDQNNYLHWTLDANEVIHGATLHLAVTDIVDGFQTREHFGAGNCVLFPKDLGHWVHVAVTYDPDAMMVTHYLNGQRVGAKNIDRQQKIAIGFANLGNWPFKTWAEGTQFEVRNMNGLMDEFMAFSRALGPDEINQIYEAGCPSQ